MGVWTYLQLQECETSTIPHEMQAGLFFLGADDSSIRLENTHKNPIVGEQRQNNGAIEEGSAILRACGRVRAKKRALWSLSSGCTKRGYRLTKTLLLKGSVKTLKKSKEDSKKEKGAKNKKVMDEAEGAPNFSGILSLSTQEGKVVPKERTWKDIAVGETNNLLVGRKPCFKDRLDRLAAISCEKQFIYLFNAQSHGSVAGKFLFCYALVTWFGTLLLVKTQDCFSASIFSTFHLNPHIQNMHMHVKSKTKDTDPHQVSCFLFTYLCITLV
ncbi:hypothetical protein VNO77_05076 [Canavalia gladiata]|uniref:Uncharacterized protein n=1 Tax=Canavalia gladiata TaxID=3824 RepID=A0AAN9MZQ3_CANGL